ncbi:hypothetical protein JCM9492_09020 [Aquifex pyrophilus]
MPEAKANNSLNLAFIFFIISSSNPPIKTGKQAIISLQVYTLSSNRRNAEKEKPKNIPTPPILTASHV